MSKRPHSSSNKRQKTFIKKVQQVVTGRLGDVYQQAQSSITGTNYCGPFTKVKEGTPALNPTDRECKLHDLNVAPYSHHIANANAADRVLQKDLGKVRKFGGVRDRATNKVARVVMGTKLGYTPFESLECVNPGKKRMRYNEFMHTSSNVRNIFSKRKKVDMPYTSVGTWYKKGRIPLINASSRRSYKGPLRFNNTRAIAKRRIGRTGRRRLRRGKSKKKICTPQLARAMANAIANLSAPVKQIVTGYGYLATAVNTERFQEPVALRLWHTTDTLLAISRATGGVTAYKSVHAKMWINATYSALSNVKSRLEIWRVTLKNQLNNAVVATSPITLMSIDSNDEPAVANTFADQGTNWDMTKVIGAITSESSNWPAGTDTAVLPGGSHYMDVTGVNLSDFVMLNKLCHVKKIADVVLEPSESAFIKLNGGKKIIQNPDDTNNTHAKLYPISYHIHRLSSFPANDDAAAGSVGTPAIAIGCVFNKHYEFRVHFTSSLQRKVLYMNNDRTNATAFSTFTDETAQSADRDA